MAATGYGSTFDAGAAEEGYHAEVPGLAGTAAEAAAGAEDAARAMGFRVLLTAGLCALFAALGFGFVWLQGRAHRKVHPQPAAVALAQAQEKRNLRGVASEAPEQAAEPQRAGKPPSPSNAVRVDHWLDTQIVELLYKHSSSSTYNY